MRNSPSARFALLALLIAPAAMYADMMPIILPAGLPPGSLYYLAFETRDTIAATSNMIATYNDFVNAQAKLAGLGFLKWYAIVSTANTSAIQNLTPALVKDRAVYLLDGKTMVTDSVDDMFSGKDLKNSIDEDQFGAPNRTLNVWTGSDANGRMNNPLGGNPAEVGADNTVTARWIAAGVQPSSNMNTVYAISNILEVAPAPKPVPEPGTEWLAGLGFGALAIIRIFGRRHRIANGFPGKSVSPAP